MLGDRRVAGAVLLSADYSQLELRILAHLSGDKALRAIFCNRGDVFRQVAARWNHKEPAQVDDALRQKSKQVGALASIRPSTAAESSVRGRDGTALSSPPRTKQKL